MKKALTQNLGMKLLSLLIAIIFWVSFINTQDPVEERTFYGIPVTLVNQEAVKEKDKIPEVTSGDTVDVVVQGKRTELDNLTKDDFVATADLSEVSFMDAVLVKIKLPAHPNVKVMNNSENVLKLIFDDYVTRKFSFRVNTSGEAQSSYVVGDAVASPNIIQISGAKTVLDTIHEVVLDVDVSGRSSDFTTTALPLVYDRNGNLIDSSKLSMNMTSVSVNVPVYPTKTIHLRVEATGELPEGYEVLSTNIAFQPEEVVVAGTKEDLKALSSYQTIKVDVTDQTGVIEKNVYLTDILDDSLTSLRVVNNQQVAITITITPYVEKIISLPVSKIELKDLPEHLVAELSQVGTVSVKVRCKSVRAAYITADSFKPYVNLQGFTEGTYHLELQLEPPATVLYTDKTYVDVIVKRKVSDGPETSEYGAY